MTEANLRNQGIKSSQDAIDRENKARDDLTKAQKSQAGAVAQQAGAAKYQGEWIMNLLNEMFTPLKPVLMWLVNTFKEFAPKVLGFGKDLITQLIIPLYKDLFGNININDILKPFKDMFAGFSGSAGGFSLKELEQNLAKFFKPMVKFAGEIVGFIDFKQVGAFFRDIFDTLGTFATELFNEMKTWDWKTIGGWLKWSLNMIGTIISDIWSGIKAAFTGEATGGDPFASILQVAAIALREVVLNLWGMISTLLSIIDYLSQFGFGTSDLLNNAIVPLGKIIGTIITGMIAMQLVMSAMSAVTFIATTYFRIYSGVLTVGRFALTAFNTLISAGSAVLRVLALGFNFLIGIVGSVVSALGVWLIPIGLVAAGFALLYANGDDLTTTLGMIGDKFWWLGDQLSWMWDKIRNSFGWLSNEDFEANNKKREEAAAERDRRIADRNKTREDNKTARFGESSPTTTPQPVASSQPVQPTVPTADQAAVERQRRADLTTKKSEETPTKETKDTFVKEVSRSDGKSDPRADMHKEHMEQLKKLNTLMEENAKWSKKASGILASRGNLNR